MRIAFLGTPAFALTALNGLLADEHYEVVGVVTQPDRPAGRKMKLQPSPVKVKALELGIPVLTPEKLNKDEDAIQQLQDWKCEVAVVVAFGQILSNKVMGIFPFGAVNLHASLLPRWRGAAPIQRAIEAGDKETGVALQKMVKALDAGDVLGERTLAIQDSWDAMDLHDELAKLGVDLLHVELMDYLRGNLTPRAQDESLVTYASKLDKSESLLDWTQNAESLFNKIRAFQMGPGTFTTFQGKRLKIHKAHFSADNPQSLSPGQVFVKDGQLSVGTGQGVLLPLVVQPESRPRVNIDTFLNGFSNPENEVFGA